MLFIAVVKPTEWVAIKETKIKKWKKILVDNNNG